MKSRALRLVLCAAMVAGAVHLASEPSAAGGCGYGWMPGIQYNIYGMDYIPYFARHPPVYYSYPVPRPYGYSPWAYPPGVMTPEYEPEPVIEPVTIVNPHVPRVKSESTESRTAQVQPLRIRNPFVESALAENEDADSNVPVAVEVRKPQVVHPAKVE